MYDDRLYIYDRTNKSHVAKLQDGAYLYRLTSLHHCGATEILTGGGTLNNPQPGRFNSPHQRTTYCANNILVCISEVLYHMYRNALSRIEKRQPASAIRASMQDNRSLVIVKVKEIDELVYTDSQDVSLDFNDPRICGTTVVFPDCHYEFLWQFNNVVRGQNKKGVFYPSARHSKDICIALFYDETTRIEPGFHEMLEIDLRLLPEDQDLSQSPKYCDPFNNKLHPTMGYYEFLNPLELDRVRRASILNPHGIPEKGMVDFVRRRYNSYPSHAVC